MAYQNYSGLWLAQSDATYNWLSDEHAQVTASPGVDTAKIWQSYTLAPNAPLSNLIVFGDRNYAAGNDQANVIKAAAPGVLIYGGRGEDVFVGSGGSGTTFIVGLGEGNKVIQNFAEGADHLRLIGGNLTTFEAVKGAMTQQGSDVVLNDGGTMIAFRNATVSQFQASDFQLPLDYARLGTPIFREEFDDARTIGTNWVTNYGYAGDGLNSFTLPGNGEQQLYTSASFKGTSGAPLGLDPFSFSNGVMTISAKPVSDAQAGQMWGYRYSSGMIESNFAQTYGYFEVRAELPHGQGLWPAFWLLGEQNREIDVLEALGSDTKVSNNAIHSATVPQLGNASFNPYGDGFHTYGTMWTPQTITFYVDGTPVWQTATPAEMSTPMKMIVNLAVGGNWPGSPNASTPFPAEMKIDYVRVYNLPDPNYHAPSPPPPPPPVSPPPPPPPPPPVSGSGLVLTSDHPGAVLAGGAGADTLNASQGADRLTGAAGADVFAFKAMPWSAGHITDFQVGVDKLDLTALYMGGYRGSDPVADGYVSFVSDGAGGTKVLLDPDGHGTAQAWPFTVVTLDGVSASGLTAAQVFNGAGAPATSPPPPPPPPSAGGVVLTAAYPGANLAGGTGADTLNASQGSGQLTGGAGADVFAFKAMPWSAGHITDFQVGVDKLDLSALYLGGYRGSDPVADGYVSFVSDGMGGTKVLLDPDGRGTAQTWPFTVVTLDGVSANGLTAAQVFNGAGAPATTPSTTGVVLTSPYPGASLAGGAGADTLNASQGSDQLAGGAGADHFVFGALPWSAGHITDFQHGVDVLDLRPLFAAAGYQGGDPIADGYLRLEADGAGGTRVLFDRDGWGSGNPWPTTITTLDHVAPSTVTSADWLFH